MADQTSQCAKYSHAPPSDAQTKVSSNTIHHKICIALRKTMTHINNKYLRELQTYTSRELQYTVLIVKWKCLVQFPNQETIKQCNLAQISFLRKKSPSDGS